MNWDLVWAIWAGIAFLSFAALELLGLREPGGTLSERLRAWLGIRPVKPWRTAGAALLLGALAVLGYHITWGA